MTYKQIAVIRTLKEANASQHRLIKKLTARNTALEGVVTLAEENMPWPEECWTMTTDEYVKAVPDNHIRTCISGFLKRKGWELAIEYIREQLEGGSK